ncbi:MAG: hypothetical protein ACKVOQ_02595 [Cyclobacteriaceae bacterium]
MSKEELENMNIVWKKYGSGNDFIQLATKSEKSIFETMALRSKSSSEAFNNSISKLSNEVSLKYSFENGSMYNALISLDEEIRYKNSENKSNRKDAGMCMHMAMAEYYSMMGSGVSEGYAFVYMHGFYAGCIS